MNNRELIDGTFAFQEKEQIPFAVLDGHTWICKKNNLSPLGMLRLPDAGAQVNVDAFREMGSALMYGGVETVFFPIAIMGGEVNDDIVGTASEVVRRPIEDVSEIENYDVKEYITKLKESEVYLRNQEQVRNMRKIVGDETHIVVGGYGAFTIASQMIGVDTFLVEVMDDEDGYTEKMIQFAAELIMEFNKGMIEAGGDVVFLCEPVASGDLISQSMFEEYVLPINEEMIKRTKEFCPNVLMHICGNTAVRVASVANSGAAGFSVDSIDMEKASEDGDKKLTMMGNLSPSDIVLNLSADKVYEKALELCKKMKGKSGFILAPGCDLPPDTPIENIQAMARAAKEA